MEEEKHKIKVLIAKIGLDGHDRGAKIIARTLKDAGMDVKYTGLRKTVDYIVDTAIEDDVDVLGLSFLSGDHMVQVPRVMNRLKDRNAKKILVVAGGIILKDQIPELTSMGINRIFLPGTPTNDIVKYIRENVTKAQQ